MTVAGRHMAPPPARGIWRDHRAVEDAIQLAAAAVIRAAKRQQQEAWKRWEDGGEPVLMPLLVPTTRNGAPAGEAEVMLVLDGPRAAATLPDGQSAALVPKPANSQAHRDHGDSD